MTRARFEQLLRGQPSKAWLWSYCCAHQHGAGDLAGCIERMHVFRMWRDVQAYSSADNSQFHLTPYRPVTTGCCGG
jgi:hypothetical protein